MSGPTHGFTEQEITGARPGAVSQPESRSMLKPPGPAVTHLCLCCRAVGPRCSLELLWLSRNGDSSAPQGSHSFPGELLGRVYLQGPCLRCFCSGLPASSSGLCKNQGPTFPRGVLSTALRPPHGYGLSPCCHPSVFLDNLSPQKTAIMTRANHALNTYHLSSFHRAQDQGRSQGLERCSDPAGHTASH